jgi:hypothetical protein
MRFIHHEDDHRGRVFETMSSHASYLSREAVRRRVQDDYAALQITLDKLDESVHMSKLGNVVLRCCEAVEASAKASATRRVHRYDAGMSARRFSPSLAAK